VTTALNLPRCRVPTGEPQTQTVFATHTARGVSHGVWGWVCNALRVRGDLGICSLGNGAKLPLLPILDGVGERLPRGLDARGCVVEGQVQAAHDVVQLVIRGARGIRAALRDLPLLIRPAAWVADVGAPANDRGAGGPPASREIEHGSARRVKEHECGIGHERHCVRLDGDGAGAGNGTKDGAWAEGDR
jgi:hypothetical protein